MEFWKKCFGRIVEREREREAMGTKESCWLLLFWSSEEDWVSGFFSIFILGLESDSIFVPFFGGEEEEEEGK